MATTWAVTLLLVGYLSVCDGAVCLARRSRSDYGYGSRSLYYMKYIYCVDRCCGTYPIRYCCTSILRNFHWYHYLLLFILFVILCICIGLIVARVKSRCRRKVRPTPPPRTVTNSGVSSRNCCCLKRRGRMASGDGEQPVNHYPFPPSYKPRDPPPPFDYSGPAHPPGNNSGQINTRTLPPGTIHPPPSMPPPAWQAPAPGSPPPSMPLPASQAPPPRPPPPSMPPPAWQAPPPGPPPPIDQPPMPQPTTSQSHPPPTEPSLEASTPNRPPVTSPPTASSIHPHPAHLPPVDREAFEEY